MEIGFKIKKITISNPYADPLNGKVSQELRADGEKGELLYLVGDNDIRKLMQDALKEYYKNKKEMRGKHARI